MNLCMNGTIESGVETLRARVEYNMGVKGGRSPDSFSISSFSIKKH